VTPKIPSSLKWLIDKRARLEAEVRKTEASIGRAKSLIEELSSLKDSLAAIDQTLGMHEIRIDINLIQPVRSHYVRVNLPYGVLTRTILMCLRLRAGEGPVSMSEIVSFIEARYADLSVQPKRRLTLSRAVHNRLKNLFHRGVIQRHHSPDENKEGLWTLAEENEDLP
jgi:hypothetical protein